VSNQCLKVLAGLELGGATLTAFDDLAPDTGVVGRAVFSPARLLGDLELRLGLVSAAEPEAVRIARWAERMERSASADCFYAKSFEVDALGTARAVLALRDSLSLAGWNGEAVASGGSRLTDLEMLENSDIAATIPPGTADRVRNVDDALRHCRVRFYSELCLAEPRELWPSRWQSVFRALERIGTCLTEERAVLTGARPDTDLGQIQAVLSKSRPADGIRIRGDGSFLRVTAETSWEAARASAALFTGLTAASAVVIRQGDASALDHALSTHGIAPQGLESVSPWRAALQVLPLALELGFEPKDPYRVLELLTLPVGPFQGLPGHCMTRALADSPGIGSPAWEAAKIELATRANASEVLTRIRDWLEQPGADSLTGASKTTLLTIIGRVREWLLSRIASTPDDTTLLAAAASAAALRLALENDPRATFSLIDVRRLAESVIASGTSVRVHAERTGRLDHVANPAGLAVSREVVIWWSFADDGCTSSPLPFRRDELLALASAGVRFPDQRARLAARADKWRRAALAATRRLILITPLTVAGAKLAPHPLWDEIVARSGLEESAFAFVQLRASDLLLAPSTLLPAPPLEALKLAELPGGRAEWAVPTEESLPVPHFSATSLNELLACPLRWALHYRAGVRSGGHTLPPLFLLNGQLGHRLIELLHAQSAFELEDAGLETQAGSQLDELFQREGATLLRAGMGFERAQLRRQLIRAVVELARTLRTCGLRIVEVEKAIDFPWRGAKLLGRIDLLVAAPDGTRGVIDVKWGASSYRDLLTSGRALQLAAYSFALAEAGPTPDAAYFSLKQGRLFGLGSALWPQAEVVGGPCLSETWAKVERSTNEVERCAIGGRLPVTGIRRSLPLLQSLGIADADHNGHFTIPAEEGCKYCDLDALCGRRWESLS
jgi:ATP-dependent helicase/nuclease subunit B